MALAFNFDCGWEESDSGAEPEPDAFVPVEIEVDGLDGMDALEPFDAFDIVAVLEPDNFRGFHVRFNIGVGPGALSSDTLGLAAVESIETRPSLSLSSFCSL